MPVVTLPDGSAREFAQPVTVMQIAEDIGPGLAKAALAGRVDGRLVDACVEVEQDAEVAIITSRDEEGVEILRHSLAHMLGQAVKQLYPDAQMAVGPVIKEGFYYDIAREESFTEEDLEKIEAKVQELIAQDYDVLREVVTRERAREVFEERGETYKVQIVDEIPEGEEIALYHHQEYVDMCRGPHVPNTRHLRAFKLTKLAGAYWRGDSRNEMLQRIYGTAWADAKQLRAYLHRLEEAQKRDHRKLARAMDLCHFQEEAPGMVFWHANGWTLYRQLENYIRERLDQAGYQEVHTPQILDRTLWEQSGHWDKFGEMIFTTESESREYAVKPMNCPGHVQLFNQGLKSYRDLPLRMAEFGTVHRNEPSGTLHGLMRARRFVQDDAHIFCTPSQLQDEIADLIELTRTTYRDFGFEDIILGLSTRPDRRIGEDALWDRAEEALDEALTATGLEFAVHPGEGAFYGPKIEFTLTDCIGREWQCGTIQLDFSMPDRLDARYVDEHSEKVVPVMIHRAIFGSLERFIGILVEHYAGDLPLWLAPCQAMVLNITDAQADYAGEVTARLQAAGVRAHSDLRNEKISFKIREHTLAHVLYLLVVGDRERENREVAVRARDGADLGPVPLDELAERFAVTIRARRSNLMED
ncbi:MAG: threonine--tRNA ligase [Gammaproteobacteria bacterium]|nr:threonine--tRNA ligase [Gammaproteobacteria bacterium]